MLLRKSKSVVNESVVSVKCRVIVFCNILSVKSVRNEKGANVQRQRIRKPPTLRDIERSRGRYTGGSCWSKRWIPSLECCYKVDTPSRMLLVKEVDTPSRKLLVKEVDTPSRKLLVKR